MNVYVETSALLSWLLGEASGPQVSHVLTQATSLVSSELTLAECGRALARLPADQAARRQQLESRCASMAWIPISGAVLSAVSHPFPVEPVRTLDAIHLCSALEVRRDFPGLAVLSLDHRVRDNAAAYGFVIYP